jgi:hypothetical protein
MFCRGVKLSLEQRRKRVIKRPGPPERAKRQELVDREMS